MRLCLWIWIWVCRKGRNFEAILLVTEGVFIWYVLSGLIWISDMNSLDFFFSTFGSSCFTSDEAGLLRKDIKKSLLLGNLFSSTLVSIFQEALLCYQPNNLCIGKWLPGFLRSGCGRGALQLWGCAAICWGEARVWEKHREISPSSSGLLLLI